MAGSLFADWNAVALMPVPLLMPAEHVVGTTWLIGNHPLGSGRDRLAKNAKASQTDADFNL